MKRKTQLYKVTKDYTKKLIEDVDYLDCKNTIVDLDNQFVLSKEMLNEIVLNFDGYCAYVTEEPMLMEIERDLKNISK